MLITSVDLIVSWLSESCFCIQFAGSAWDELKHIRQAVGFLVRFGHFNLYNLK